jgi:segregation and condensation protein B
VLEHVAGGWAFRSSREAAEACARLFEKPAQRNLSQAAMETLAIVAYLGPCSRPDVARIRGVAADSAVANLQERGLIAEAGRDDAAGGAIRYRTTPLFERIFGLESLSALPRLDDVGADAERIRERLHEVAEKRTA